MKREKIILLLTIVGLLLFSVQSPQAQFVRIYSGKINGLEWTNAYYGSANELSVAFGDLDADGDLDLVQGSRYRLEWIKNIGSSHLARLEALQWGNIVYNDNKFWFPALVDLDHDHDLDMVCGQLDGTLAYFQNSGSATEPVWRLPVYNWLSVSLGAQTHPSFCDIDHDGDQDLFIGNSSGKLYYYQNTGTAAMPIFSLQTDLYVETGTSGQTTPFFCDLNQDGDFDLLLSRGSISRIALFQNTGTPEAAAWTLDTAEYAGIHGDDGMQATMADIDGDADLDLFYTDRGGFFHTFGNTGTPAAPIWTYVHGNSNLSLNFGVSSTPTLGDFDGDGDLDALIGTEYVYVLENVSSAGVLAWRWFGSKAVELRGVWLTPKIVDIDADGDLDLFVGTVDGGLYYYENTGTRFVANLVQITDHYNSVTFGKNSHVSVEFADIDNDLDQDMFVQHFNHLTGDSLIFYENVGTAHQPIWNAVDSNYMQIGSHGVRFGTCDFADLDDDGDLDGLFGTFKGKLVCFANSGTAAVPIWTGVTHDSLAVENKTFYSTPAVGDVDGDARPDIVSGLDGGGLNIWLNATSTGWKYQEKRQPDALVLLGNYPNPFNSVTDITYRLSQPALVRLDIVDVTGRLSANLVESRKPAGEHTVQWNAAAVPSGVYFCCLQVDGYREVRKMVLIK